jgi:hypothetical protein
VREPPLGREPKPTAALPVYGGSPDHAIAIFLVLAHEKDAVFWSTMVRIVWLFVMLELAKIFVR